MCARRVTMQISGGHTGPPLLNTYQTNEKRGEPKLKFSPFLFLCLILICRGGVSPTVWCRGYFVGQAEKSKSVHSVKRYCVRTPKALPSGALLLFRGGLCPPRTPPAREITSLVALVCGGCAAFFFYILFPLFCHLKFRHKL